MKKLLGLLILGLLILPSVLAIDIDLEKRSSRDVIVAGLDDPAIFTFDITNNEATDDFYFFNLLGFSLSPNETIEIKGNEYV